MTGFNPRPSCEGRLVVAGQVGPKDVFQSTPLLRGATSAGSRQGHRYSVSIHAPLARGDLDIIADEMAI